MLPENRIENQILPPIEAAGGAEKAAPNDNQIQEIKDWTRKFLWEWQDSPMSPGDAAEIIVNRTIELLTTYPKGEAPEFPMMQPQQSAYPPVGRLS